MKKKILALISAGALTLMSSITAFAAGSPAVGSVEQPSQGQFAITMLNSATTPEVGATTTATTTDYSVSAVSAQTQASAEVAAQNLVLNQLAATAAGTGNAALAGEVADPTAVVTASILATVDVKPVTAQKVNGYYTVTLYNAAIAAGDTIVILHFNGTSWEAIYPAIVGDGFVIFLVSDLSPISIVKVSANSAVAQAPKTGRTLPVAAMAFTAFAAGALYCGKKYFA
jgi:hypothetical protein